MTDRLVLLLVLTLALPLLSATPAPAQDRLAITSVTVVDVVVGSLRRDQTVLVEGDRIITVDDADVVTAPPGAVVVEGAGKYLIPGLWDMHVHSRADEATRTIVLPLYVAPHRRPIRIGPWPTSRPKGAGSPSAR